LGGGIHHIIISWTIEAEINLIAPCRAIALFLPEKKGGREEGCTAVETGGGIADGTMTTITTAVVAWATATMRWQTEWKYMLCTTRLSSVTTLLSKEVGASMSKGGGGIRGNKDNKGEVSKGAITRGNEGKGEVSEGAVGNGNTEGESRWEASEGAGKRRLCFFLEWY
jgi:hypothetical protein